MPLVVNDPIELPTPQITPGAEVATKIQITAGLSRIAATQNTLWEILRASAVTDYDPDVMLGALGDTAKYRPSNVGQSGLITSEKLTVELYLILQDVNSPSPTDAEITITVDGTGVLTFNYSVDLLTITRVLVGEVTIPDDAVGLLDIEVEITDVAAGAPGEFVDIQVFGIDVYWSRDRATIPSVTGLGGPADAYDCGFVPQDTNFFAGDSPVTTAQLQEMNDNAVCLVETRASWNFATGWSKDIHDGTVLSSTAPPGSTEARIRVLIDAAAATPYRVILTHKATQITAIDPAAGAWHEFTLTDLEQGERHFFIIDADKLVIESVCANWVGSIDDV
jgi:hypothetical protein